MSPKNIAPQALKSLGFKSFLDVDAKERFLNNFRKCLNVSRAAELSKLGRHAVRGEMERNPVFAAAVHDIMDAAIDELEEMQFESAKKRSDDRRWLLERLRPQIWAAKKRVEGALTVKHVNAKDMTDDQLEEMINRLAVDAEYEELDEPEEGTAGGTA